MKKIILFSIIAVTSILFTNSCEKLGPDDFKENSTNSTYQSIVDERIVEDVNYEVIEKGPQCSCSVSCFWSSCETRCPVTNGVCTAVCSCASVVVWGLSFGTTAICGCGSATVGSVKGLYLDDENIIHFENFKTWIQGINSPTMNKLRAKLNVVINVANNNNPSVGNAVSKFLIAIEEVTESEAQHIATFIEKRVLEFNIDESDY